MARAIADAKKAGRTPPVQRPTDVVSGHLEVELLLPTEIVTIFVNAAYAQGKDDVARLVLEDAAAKAVQYGLPDDFVATFEREMTDFIALQTQENELLGRIARNETDPIAGMAKVHRLRELQCHPRATAVQRLRAIHGSAFDRFLYLGIAPGMGSSVYNPDRDAAMLRRQEAGCR